MRSYLKMLTPAALAAFMAACATGGRQEQPVIVPRETAPALEEVVVGTIAQPLAPQPTEVQQQPTQAAVQVATAPRPVRPVPEGVVSDSVQYSFDWDRRTPMWRLSENLYFQRGTSGIKGILERFAQYNNILLSDLNNKLTPGATMYIPLYNGREVKLIEDKARNGDDLRSFAYRAIAKYTQRISHASGFTDDGISVVPIEEARRRGLRIIREIPPGDYYADRRAVVQDDDGIHGDNPAKGRAPNETIRIVVPGYFAPDPSQQGAVQPAATPAPAGAPSAPPTPPPATPSQAPPPAAPPTGGVTPDSASIRLDNLLRGQQPAAPDTGRTTPPPTDASNYNGANSNLVVKIAEYNGLRTDATLRSGDYVRFAIGGREFAYQVPFNNRNGNADIRLQAFVDRVIQPQLNNDGYLALTTFEHARKQKLTIVGSAVPGKNYEKDSDLVTVVLGDITDQSQTAPASATHSVSNPSNASTPNTSVASLERTLILDPVKVAEAWVASRYGNGVAEQPLSDRVYIPGQRTSGIKRYQPRAA